ncbi:hypothetical protein [Pseudoalteromonas luteoviolacea]|uniref:DUF304 domain-containing protein n=1 Tax=Pseudoalteromonas luteoviolacea S4054 TaxID=1129367 RepID=A0A0F6AI99_9GAMM|nr:hypothetical protein [Pseudoalteromonas luteoviolacea]AOT06455.1 hypothetical protein S4054249_00465 [Pseudoalteromonas luteoviolacea]AOT11372.1 hypothetical protein S40542_00465 [Pseudoalteromonas luteoviolacea]AOT16285.1 hypothetical protein S4054_00465 [Pseudoalteromonas luteoviolacea]KKE85536.1 hypothetical protein N479_04355 [Pseudoalteromonas luteoviolacea S4054]KZN73058.1 hypothetical protein N481_13475 [Pseudoalteromonas luteoviolacea S4047-1]
MKTINLQVNWYVYSLQLIASVLLYIVLLHSGFDIIAKVAGGSGAVVTMISLISSILGKKYVHIDKAGFSYRSWSPQVNYLHSDEISVLKVTKLLGAYVVSVEINANKQIAFPYWLANLEDVQKAAKEFNCPLIGAIESEVKA